MCACAWPIYERKVAVLSRRRMLLLVAGRRTEFFGGQDLTKSCRGVWGWLVEILLEAGEDVVDFIGLAEVGDGVGNRVVVFEPEQRGEFGLVELLHADGDVVGQDEIEKRLLFGAETGVDVDFCVGRPNLAREWRHGKFAQDLAALHDGSARRFQRWINTLGSGFGFVHGCSLPPSRAFLMCRSKSDSNNRSCTTRYFSNSLSAKAFATAWLA